MDRMIECPNDSTLQEDIEQIAESRLPLMSLKDSCILITGATGLVGSQLVKALACCNRKHRLNITLLLLVRSCDKAIQVLGDLSKRDDIQLLIGDVTSDPAEYLPENKNIDYIVHAASVTASKVMITKPVETIEVAISGTKKMLELARIKQVKSFVYISSMEVYGSFEQGKYVSETDMGYIDPLAVRSNYPLCKRLCENMCIAYCNEYHVPVRIARLSQTFGAGVLQGENRVFAQFARSAMKKENIILHTKGRSEGNYCYTRDTVTAIILLMLCGKDNEAYNIANEACHTTIVDMAQMVAEEIAGGTIHVIFDIPETNTFGYASDTHMKLNTAKMQSLGWNPSVGLEEAYKRMMQSMLETGV